jgi:hypothetical protein
VPFLSSTPACSAVFLGSWVAYERRSQAQTTGAVPSRTSWLPGRSCFWPKPKSFPRRLSNSVACRMGSFRMPDGLNRLGITNQGRVVVTSTPLTTRFADFRFPVSEFQFQIRGRQAVGVGWLTWMSHGPPLLHLIHGQVPLGPTRMSHYVGYGRSQLNFTSHLLGSQKRPAWPA